MEINGFDGIRVKKEVEAPWGRNQFSTSFYLLKRGITLIWSDDQLT